MNRQVYTEVQRESITTPPTTPAQRQVYHQEVVSNEPVVTQAPVTSREVHTTVTTPVQQEVYHQEVVSNGPAVAPAPVTAREVHTTVTTHPAPVVDNTVVRERTVVSGPAYTTTEYTLGKVTQIMNYILGVFEALMLLRFVLRFIGANPTNAFAQLIYGLTEPMAALFNNLIPNPAVAGSNIVIEITTLIAMLFWALLFGAGIRLLRLALSPPDRRL
ncbi:MAG: YggT family protein [Anaerolineae bacterium]|nr:YggT family protein [Anaerolineae bacterium]